MRFDEVTKESESDIDVFIVSGKHSVHTSDNHQETVGIGTIILNPNSLIVLNNSDWSSPMMRARLRDFDCDQNQQHLADLRDCAGQVRLLLVCESTVDVQWDPHAYNISNPCECRLIREAYTIWMELLAYTLLKRRGEAWNSTNVIQTRLWWPVIFPLLPAQQHGFSSAIGLRRSIRRQQRCLIPRDS